MATVRFRIPGERPPFHHHRRAVLIGRFERIGLPITAPEVAHTDVGRAWAELERTGRKPLLVPRELKLTKLSFDVTLVRTHDQEANVNDYIAKLRRLARGTTPLAFAYGYTERGAWQITSLTFRTVRRRQGPNDPTRIDATIELTESSVENTTRWVRPPAPTAARRAAEHPASRPGPRTHVVVAGDTLWNLAVAYYGNGSEWTRIAAANGIRDARHLTVGQRLVIP